MPVVTRQTSYLDGTEFFIYVVKINVLLTLGSGAGRSHNTLRLLNTFSSMELLNKL